MSTAHAIEALAPAWSSMQWEPLLVGDEVRQACDRWREQQPTVFAVMALGAMDRPRMVDFLRDLIGSDGGDEASKLADAAFAHLAWLQSCVDVTETVAGRAFAALAEAAGIDPAELSDERGESEDASDAEWTAAEDTLSRLEARLRDAPPDDDVCDPIVDEITKAQHAIIALNPRTVAQAIRRLELALLGGELNGVDDYALFADARRLARPSRIDPHATWLAARERVLEKANGSEIHRINELSGRSVELDNLILDTPATTAVGAASKLLLIAIMAAQGEGVAEATAAAVVGEARHLLKEAAHV